MKRAYIAVSFAERGKLKEVIDILKQVLNTHQITPVVFIEQYRFEPTQEREMMQQALSVIDSCDLLIAETSYKQIGIGIEAGYAKGKNKPIVYVRRNDAEHSTTMSGIADRLLLYYSETDLREKVHELFKDWQV